MPQNNTDVLNKPWGDIVDGLKSAGITAPDRIGEATDAFNKLEPANASNIVGKAAVNSAGWWYVSGNENARHLLRALNFLKALQVSSIGATQFSGLSDEVWRKYYNAVTEDGGRRLPELSEQVRKEFEIVFPRQLPAPDVPVVVQAVSIVTPRPAISPSNTSTIQQIEAILSPAQRGWKAVSTKVSAAVQDRGNRKIEVLQNSAKIEVAWLAAKEEIINIFANDQTRFLYNFANMNAAIGAAYKEFDKKVGENQAADDTKIKVAKLCFLGLSKAPFPVSLIGTIGSAGMKLLAKDKLQTTINHKPLEHKKSGIVAGIMNGVKDIETDFNHLTRLGVKLDNIPVQATLTETLDWVCSRQIEALQRITKDATEEVFGNHMDAHSKLQKIKENFSASSLSAGMMVRGGLTHSKFYTGKAAMAVPLGEQNLIDNFIRMKITNYKDETIEAIRNELGWKPNHVEAGDLRDALELLLFSHFVSTFYSANHWKMALHDDIVNRFAKPDGWGILALNGAHTESDKMHRLNWKGGEDHKRSLVLFCNWYKANINPFYLVAGVYIDGQQFTGAVIKQKIRDHVDLINKAINYGRSKNFLYSSWDWQKITDMYVASTVSVEFDE